MARAVRPWVDITMEFGAPQGTWPGDTPFSFEWTGRVGDQEWGVNLARFQSSPHNGTHADAPFHVLADGGASETLDLEAFVGPCLVVDASNVRESQLPASLIGDQKAPERILFRTQSRGSGDAFPREFKGLSEELSQRLVRDGVRLAGIDSPSIDAHDARGLRAHKTLFRGGTYVLENLVLHHVQPGPYELVALPLKVKGLCAAPVRAILRAA